MNKYNLRVEYVRKYIHIHISGLKKMSSPIYLIGISMSILLIKYG